MRVLDLFCGAGGAAMGLHQALEAAGIEHEITGVDIKPQPRYPFTFIQMDAQTFLANQTRGDFAGEFDFAWASPPCQHYTQMLNHGLTPRSKHPDMIAWVRKCLPYITENWLIENVAGAPLHSPVMLCGESFGLRVTRHRFFESSFVVVAPAHSQHRGKGIRSQAGGGYYYRVYGHETGKAEWGNAMGIDWMKTPELAQAIPPAYSCYIMEQFLAHQYTQPPEEHAQPPQMHRRVGADQADYAGAEPQDDGNDQEKPVCAEHGTGDAGVWEGDVR